MGTDGLPLAIELAAARANVMSPPAIRDRLADRFRLLSGRSRGASSRHATLRGAIDWSWNLLSEWEREALAQCSVFRGGWTLEAAEAVVDVSVWEEAPWTVDIIQSLKDKSLVRTLPVSNDGKDGGEMRFGLYESIREYAAGKLAASKAVETRHGEFYARFGEEDAVEALRGPRGVEALRELEPELENLVAAARRASARGDPAVAARAALAASEVFELRGPFDFGMSLISEALGSGPDDELAVRLGLRRGRLAWLAGKVDEALAMFESALALARGLGSRKSEGMVLWNLGILHWQRGRIEEARASYDAALAIFREVGDRRNEGIVLGDLGVMHREEGRIDEARQAFDAGEALLRAVDDSHELGRLLCGRAALEGAEGDPEEARNTLAEARALAAKVGAGPESELGHLLTETQRKLEGP